MDIRKDIGSAIKCVTTVLPVASGAATNTGAAVDRMPSGGAEGYDSAVLVVHIGAATGTPTSFTVDAVIHESDASGSGFAVCSPTIAMTQQTTGSQLQQVDFDCSKLKRYLKAVVTVAISGGSSPTVPVSATLVLGGAAKKAAA